MTATQEQNMIALDETPAQEFSRLVIEYNEGEKDSSERQEAWNLIADFALEHCDTIRRALASPAQEPVAWPIDTDDQVEALARECDWNNRRYMTPADYSGWCEQMRKFARLAVPPPAQLAVKALEKTAQFLWALLDDIDTAGDIAKSDDKAYRARVEAIQRRRFEVGSTDGYAVTFDALALAEGQATEGMEQRTSFETLLDRARQAVVDLDDWTNENETMMDACWDSLPGDSLRPLHTAEFWRVKTGQALDALDELPAVPAVQS